MAHEFDINVIGNDTGKKFKGHFVFKRMSIRQKLDAEKHEKRLTGELALSPETQFIVYIISYLKEGLIEYPDWWEDIENGLDFYDANVLTEIHKSIKEYEDNWQKQLEENSKESNKDNEQY